MYNIAPVYVIDIRCMSFIYENKLGNVIVLSKQCHTLPQGIPVGVALKQETAEKPCPDNKLLFISVINVL